LPAQFVEELYAQAKAALPNECCGLLAGQVEGGVGRVVQRYPLRNAAGSRVEYDAAPADLIAAHREMRRLGIGELAVYHSHPTSPPVPSRKDLARNGYGETVVHLIISLMDGEPLMRGWRLTAEDYREEKWEVD
jgi:proteasome lid subunit RPN8/RPN11